MKQQASDRLTDDCANLPVALLNAVDALLVVLDDHGRVVQFNHACEQATGFGAGSVQGQLVGDVLLGPDALLTVEAALARLRAGEDVVVVDHEWVTAAGRGLPISWSYAAVRDAQGDVAYVVGTGHHKRAGEHAALLLETSQSLQQITRTLLQKLTTLDDVLALVCAEARRLTGATGSAVLLLEEADRLVVRAANGRPHPSLTHLPVHASLAGAVIAREAPLLLNDVDSRRQAYYRTPNLQALLAAPLRAGDETIGVLDVVNKPGGFLPEDRHIIALFADQAAVAIENARLHQRAEQLAIVEERQRLARELHDSVTQSLYTVTLYAHAAHKALSAGKEAVAVAHLGELRALAREVTLEMRLLLFELHPPVLEKEGVVTAVQTRLDAVESRLGLQTDFSVTGTERHLPLAVEEALYRIAQEALTNAVKHARPQFIGVELHFADDQVTLRIQDDGMGFDVAQATHTAGLGLRSIKERVAKLDGTLSLESAPGDGTVLTICIAA